MAEMRIFGRMEVSKKPYVIAGFGAITAKRYLIKRDKQGEYAILNMKKVYLRH